MTHPSCSGVPKRVRSTLASDRARPCAAVLMAAAVCLHVCADQRSAHAQESAPTGADEARVGVVVANAINLSRARANELSKRLGEVLRGALLVEVVTDSGTAQSDNLDACWQRRRCVRRVGKAMNVQELLFLSMVRIGQRTNIDVIWADVKSGRSRQRSTFTLSEEQPYLEEWARRAPELLPDARPRPAKKTDVQDVSSAGQPDDRDPVKAPALAPVDRGRHMTTGVWIAGGIGAAALIAGASLGVAAVSQDGELRGRGCVARYVCEEVSALQFKVNMADAMFATAAVAGALAFVLYYRSGRERRPGPISIVPTPTGVQVYAGIRF